MFKKDDLDDLNFQKSRQPPVQAVKDKKDDNLKDIRGESIEKRIYNFDAEEVSIRNSYVPIEDEKIVRRLERIQELMYRFDGTGVWRAVQVMLMWLL